MAEGSCPSQKILDSSLKLWGIPDRELKFIRGNENWVYEVDDLIFRFTGIDHRTSLEIEAEIDWIQYLADKNLSICTPVPSTQNKIIEALSDFWNCVVFHKAPGIQLKKPEHFTNEVFESWGRLTGQMHHWTRSYKPKIEGRKNWQEDDGFLLSQKAVESMDPTNPMVVQYQDILAKMKSLPMDDSAFGLIHGDFHHGNFHFDHSKNQIHLFDFDDCNYFWFAFDLIIPFASLEFTKCDGRLDLDYSDFQKIFMEAYHKENNLDPLWIKQLPLFTRYRVTSLYFWSWGRFLENRGRNEKNTRDFMRICEKLALE